MNWVFFGIGLLLGGSTGLLTAALCAVSGREARLEERMDDCTEFRWQYPEGQTRGALQRVDEEGKIT